MFFRKGEKLLLACLIAIMVCAMSGCGLIGKIYEDGGSGILDSFLEKEDEEKEEVPSNSQIIINGMDSDDPGYILNGGSISIDMDDIGYEKLAFNYVVHNDMVQIFREPAENPVTVGVLTRGEVIPIYYKTNIYGHDWGKSDMGWVNMGDLTYEEMYEKETVALVDERIVGGWNFVTISYEDQRFIHNGTLFFGDDGKVVYFSRANVYSTETCMLDFVGSLDFETRCAMGTYFANGDTLYLTFDYVEDKVGEVVTKVCGYYFYDGILILNDEYGNELYAYGGSLSGVCERFYSGVE
jgi:hypothetical protein